MAKFRNGLGRVGKYWHYCFKVEGRVFRGSTHVTDHATAEKFLADKRREAALSTRGLFHRMPTVRDLLKQWLEVHRTVFSAKHLISVEGCMRLWVLPRLGDRRIDMVTTQDMLDARQRILDAGRSPLTANLMVRTVRLLWGFAIKLGYLDSRPFQVEQIKVQQTPRPTVPATALTDYLAEIDRSRNPHVSVMVRVIIGLGLRESEVLGMRWEWFDPGQRTYCVGKSKTKTSRTLPVPQWVWEFIERMPRALSPWVFPAEDGTPHRPAFLHKPLARAAKKLGLGRVSAHRLRATFASLHAEFGTPITEIQGMLGHRCIQTTMIYVEQSLENKRRAQDAMSHRLGFSVEKDASAAAV
ncbi:MAG: site-specific integrase [Holophagaceae bacterium]